MIKKTAFTLLVLFMMILPAAAEPTGFKNYSQYGDVSSIDMSIIGVFKWFFDVMDSKSANLFIPLLILTPITMIYIKSESIDLLFIMIVFSSALIKVFFMASFSNIIYWLIVLPLAVVIYKVLVGRS